MSDSKRYYQPAVPGKWFAGQAVFLTFERGVRLKDGTILLCDLKHEKHVDLVPFPFKPTYVLPIMSMLRPAAALDSEIYVPSLDSIQKAVYTLVRDKTKLRLEGPKFNTGFAWYYIPREGCLIYGHPPRALYYRTLKEIELA